MRTLKFRGVNNLTGEYVYRELGNIFMTCKGDKYYFGSENDVLPETVSQLIAVDKNGHEVYEGDKVYFFDKPRSTWEATFRDYGDIVEGFTLLAG